MQQLGAAAFIAENAGIFGKVSIGEGSSVWFNSVIRAEFQHITIGRYSNIQDFAMLHIGFNDPVQIGDMNGESQKIRRFRETRKIHVAVTMANIFRSTYPDGAPRGIYR